MRMAPGFDHEQRPQRGLHEQDSDFAKIPAPGEATAGDRRICPRARGQVRESPLWPRAEDDSPVARSLARGGPRRARAAVPDPAGEPPVPRVGSPDRTGPARTRVRRAPGSRVAAPRSQAGVSLAAIQRTFTRLGLPRLPRRGKPRPRPRQVTLFEKPVPEDSVQVDVKVVKIGGRKVFQYTAWTTARASGCYGCIGAKTSGRAWTSSARSGEPCHSPFGNFSPTTVLNSRWPS